MATPRIGVVGVGTFGINHLRCFRQMGYNGTAQLVAAADLNPKLLEERAHEFGFTPYTDFRQMLAKEKLDGIVAPQPFDRHGVLVPELLKAETRRVLNAVGLFPKRNEFPENLSGGEQQRVAWSVEDVSRQRLIEGVFGDFQMG